MPITFRLWRQSEKHIYPLLGQICAARVFVWACVRGWFTEVLRVCDLRKKKNKKKTAISSDNIVFSYVFIGG